MEQKMDFKICRLCLKQTLIAHSLTEAEGAKYLEDVAQIQINESDIFPKQACVSCWQSLKYAYQIRENILQTDRNFEKMTLLADADENGYISEESILAVIKELYLKKLGPEKIANIEDKVAVPENIENIKDTVLSSSELELNKTVSKETSPTTEFIKLENHTDEPLVLLVVNDDNKKADKTKKVHKSRCKICGQKILKIEKMEHIQNHFKMMTKCEVCEIECELGNYRMHMKIAHMQDLKEVYTCPVCKATFQYYCLFQVHKEKAHLGIDFNKSIIANLQEKLGIKLHRRATNFLFSENKATKVYKCDICVKEFTDVTKFRSHKIGHVVNQCPICGKLIKGKPNFKPHVESHSDKRVICNLCGKSQKDLRGHLYAVHPKKYFRCEHCGKKYPLAYRLKLHIKKMHQGNRDFSCEQCDKKFFTRFTLKKHFQMVHLKMRKHKCQYCGKAFASRWGMLTHERQHTGVHPYVCKLCGKGFTQNVSLKTHMKSTHRTGKDDTTEDSTQLVNSTEDDNYEEPYEDYAAYSETEYDSLTEVC